jgi:hypothetical protein
LTMPERDKNADIADSNLDSRPGLRLGLEWGSLRGDAERASRAGGPPAVYFASDLPS